MSVLRPSRVPRIISGWSTNIRQIFAVINFRSTRFPDIFINVEWQTEHLRLQKSRLLRLNVYVAIKVDNLGGLSTWIPKFIFVDLNGQIANRP